MVNIEDGIQAGHLEHVLHSSARIGHLQFSAGTLHGSVTPDKFSDAGAVNVFDSGEVKDDLGFSLAHQSANDVAEYHVSFAERNSSSDIHNSYFTNLASVGMHF